ncbi:unnamed protein product [Natator depressus]
MLPLFLVLLSFGSYCSSAPTTIDLRGAIKETLKNMDTIQKSEFQNPLKTPENIMEYRCILKTFNTFIESMKSSNTNKNIKLLLIHLQAILKQLGENEPNLKEHQTDCELAEVGFEDFKEKLTSFLKFINENF